ncbi:hypothetical protein EDB19DRAFT_931506 [Suillus lakei]|nr:hypothetical protein EDB19DRAFT_931506 [Suillus lakei]
MFPCNYSVTQATRSGLWVLMVLIPLPLLFAWTIYSATGFSKWVTVSIAGIFLSAFAVVIHSGRAELRFGQPRGD